MRLTINEKENILNRILKHGFLEKIEQLNKKWQDLANDVYIESFTAKEHKLIESLPKGWLGKSSTVSTRFGESSENFCRLSFNGLMNTHCFMGVFSRLSLQTIKKVMPLEYCSYNCPPIRVFSEKHVLSKTYYKLQKDEDNLAQAFNKAKLEASSIINSCNTVGQLIKKWSEVEPFIEVHENKKSTQLMVKIDQVNSSLNLPKKDK